MLRVAGALFRIRGLGRDSARMMRTRGAGPTLRLASSEPQAARIYHSCADSPSAWRKRLRAGAQERISLDRGACGVGEIFSPDSSVGGAPLRPRWAQAHLRVVARSAPRAAIADHDARAGVWSGRRRTLFRADGNHQCERAWRTGADFGWGSAPAGIDSHQHANGRGSALSRGAIDSVRTRADAGRTGIRAGSSKLLARRAFDERLSFSIFRPGHVGAPG